VFLGLLIALVANAIQKIQALKVNVRLVRFSIYSPLTPSNE